MDRLNLETIVRHIKINSIDAIGNKICQESAAARIVGIIVEN